MHDHDTIPSLDGIRAGAVLLVLIAHAGYGDIVPGGLGVTIFFFLSGYLITTLMLKEHERLGAIDIRNFYFRRFFRLFPALFMALLITYTLTLAGVLTGGVSIEGLVAQTFYYANYFLIYFDAENKIPDGTGVLWSLAVEEHFYIVFPVFMSLLLAVSLRARAIAGIIAAICLAVLAWRFCLVHVLDASHFRTYYASDTRIDSIMYGCMLALAFNPIGHAPLSQEDFEGRSISLLIRDPAFRETLRYSLQGLALMPIFYFAIRYAGRFPFVLLNNRYLVKLGQYSYAIYLAHFVVTIALTKHFPALEMNRPVLALATLAVSVLFAAAIDTWVDPYFRGLRRQYKARPRKVEVSAEVQA
jgi:peptidoglycan/LPS O-acetylase OafA/YrhL